MRKRIKFGLKKEKKRRNRLNLLVPLGLILIVSLLILFISALETDSNFAGQAFKNSGDSPFYSFGQRVYHQLISGKDLLTGAGTLDIQDLGIQGTTYTCYNCSECDSLVDNSSNTILLGNNITTMSAATVNGTCISIATTVGNITIDCQSYYIIGDDIGTDYGITTGTAVPPINLTVQNCNFIDFGGAGIYLGRNTSTIANNNFTNNNGLGVIILKRGANILNNYFTSTTDSIGFDGSALIREIRIANNVFNSASGNAIGTNTGTDVVNLTVENNYFYNYQVGVGMSDNTGTKSDYTIRNNYFYNASTAAISLIFMGSNLLIENNTIDGQNTTTDCLDIDATGTNVSNYSIISNRFLNCPNDNIDFVSGIDVYSCDNIKFIENTLDPRGDITVQNNCSIYLLNNSFNKSAILVTLNNAITQNLVHVQWYVNITAKDGSNNLLQNAEISVYNSSNDLQYNGLTDANGILSRINLTEFIQKNNTLKMYATPHNVSGNKTNYQANFTLININQTEETILTLILPLGIFADLKVNTTDIIYTGQTVRQNDNLTFNITVYNNGDDNATNANISFYIDEIINSSILRNISTSSTSNLSFSWTALGGNHTFSVKTDPGGLISELNKTNNNATINLSIKYVAVLDYLAPIGSFPRGKNIAGEDALSEINDFLTVSGRVYDFYNSSHRFSANCTFYFNDSYLGSNLTNSSGNCIYPLNKTAYELGMYNLTMNFTNLEGEAVRHTSQTQNSTNISIFVITITPGTINHYDGLNYMVGEMAVINFSITKNNSAYAPETVTMAILGATDPEDTASIYPSQLYNDSSGFYRYASRIESAPNGGSIRWKIRINSTAEGLIATASHSDIAVSSPNGYLNLTAINSSGGFIADSILTIKDANGYALNQTNSCNLSRAIRKNKNHSLEITSPNGEKLILRNVYLNETNNNLAIQILPSKNIALPNSFKNLTPIIAFETFPFAFETANLTLPNYGRNIASVQKCSLWNITLSNCTGTWSNYPTEISQNSTHFWFNITSFSGYAGGIGYSSNLTIWDQNDTGLFGADLAAYANQQIKFYANYSNATDNTIITGANCNISFNVSPGGPSNMPFNSTNNLYQYNRTFTSAGGYFWNVTCGGNSSFDTLNATDTISLGLQSENYPYWQNNLTNIVSAYSPTTSSYFNISWLDDNGLSTVALESNYTSLSANYSMNRINGTSTNGTYNFSAIIPAGTYYWKSYANDTANQWNSTGSWYFTIARAASTVNLTINGTSANRTIVSGTVMDINCSMLIGTGNISILRNGVEMAAGFSTISSTPNFNTAGLINITCQYDQTQNYSSNFSTYWITVIDTAPAWQNNISSIAPTYSLTTFSYFNISWRDNNNLSEAVWESNYTGISINYSMNNISGAANNRIFNFSAIMPAGTFYWKSYANDSANQWNSTDSWYFTVAQAASSVNLTINGSKSNTNISVIATLNLSCNRIAGEGNIYLYQNSTLLNSGTSSISNWTTFNLSEAYNISCRYNSTQNYSGILESYLILANIDYAPNVTLNSPAAGYSNNSAADSTTAYNITFNCSALDDYLLKNISLYLTNSISDSFALNQSANLSGTANSSRWNLTLSQGNYLWNCLAYDNRSQPTFASINSTIVLSYTPFTPTPSSSSSSGGGTTPTTPTTTPTAPSEAAVTPPTTRETVPATVPARETVTEVPVTELERYAQEFITITKVSFERAARTGKEREARETGREAGKAGEAAEAAAAGRAISQPTAPEVETRPAVEPEKITITLENSGSKFITLTPRIKTEKIVLENEEKIASAITEKLSAESEKKGLVFDQKKVEDKLESLRLLEKLRVQPLDKFKKFFAFQQIYTKSGLYSSRELIEGGPLKSRVTGAASVVLNPKEKKELEIEIVPGLSADPSRPAEKIVFSSQGKDLLQKEIKVSEDLRVGTAVEANGEFLDLYLVIPAPKGNQEESSGSDQSRDYSLAVEVYSLEKRLFGKKQVYSELYGPYQVKLNEGWIFAGQLYSALEPGDYLVKTRVYQEGNLVAKNEFNISLTAKALGIEELELKLELEKSKLPLAGRAFSAKIVQTIRQGIWQKGIVSYSTYWLIFLIILFSTALGISAYRQARAKSGPTYPEEEGAVPEPTKPEIVKPEIRLGIKVPTRKPKIDWRTVEDHFGKKLENINLALESLQTKEPEIRPELSGVRRRRTAAEPEIMPQARVNIPKYQSIFGEKPELNQELARIDEDLRKAEIVPEKQAGVKYILSLPARPKKEKPLFSLFGKFPSPAPKSKQDKDLKAKSKFWKKDFSKKNKIPSQFSEELKEVQNKLNKI